MKNKRIYMYVSLFALFLLLAYATLSSPAAEALAPAPDTAQLRSNLSAAGLPALTEEGLVQHTHQHLTITANGKDLPVPAEIGVGNGFISPIHTHDPDGILHVESPIIRDFTLGQFFAIWGVRLDEQCVANLCADGNNRLVVAVNGAPVEGPQSIILADRQQIDIWYGPREETPRFTGTYVFPKGL